MKFVKSFWVMPYNLVGGKES